MDKTTKLLLAVIALGLWANVMISLVRPQPVVAQDQTLSSIDDHLQRIESGVSSLERIARGTCTNGKIC
jgi:hypothetical protein